MNSLAVRLIGTKKEDGGEHRGGFAAATHARFIYPPRRPALGSQSAIVAASPRQSGARVMKNGPKVGLSFVDRRPLVQRQVFLPLAMAAVPISCDKKYFDGMATMTIMVDQQRHKPAPRQRRSRSGLLFEVRGAAPSRQARDEKKHAGSSA
jgi:hypothetical protein